MCGTPEEVKRQLDMEFAE